MDKGRLINVLGDATEPQRIDKNELAVIPHVCNNVGKWGAGFVLALNKKWKQPEEEYRKYCKINRGLPILGSVVYANCESQVYVMNMIAQDGVVSSSNSKPIRYLALAKCMAQVAAYMGIVKLPAKIHCPKFGSALAGGNWDFILELIDEIWLSQGIDVIIYEWEPNKDKWGPQGDYSIDIYNSSFPDN